MRIAVLGGGFGGVEAVLEASRLGLADRCEVLWVDKNGRFEYLPALPEILSGTSTPEELSGDLKLLAKKCGAELVVGTVERVDLKGKKVLLEGGEKLEYDFVVIALGAEPTFFNVKGRENAFPAYRLDDYVRIKERLERLSGGSNVVVVGAGLTGVEVAGELAEYSHKTGKELNITVVEKMDCAVPFLRHPKASRLVEEYLVRRGVKFLYGKGVSEIKEGSVILEDGTELLSDLTIWTAGLAPNGVSTRTEAPKRGRGWIVVDPCMRICSFKDAFAVGDVNCVDIRGKIAMKMAEEAMFQAKVAVENISRTLKGKPLVEHKIIFPIDSPKSLIALGGGTVVLVYGKKVAIRSGLAYRLIKKWYIEKQYMKRFRS